MRSSDEEFPVCWLVATWRLDPRSRLAGSPTRPNLIEVTTIMLSRKWALALPLVLAASITSTHAATIRDDAGMFSADAVRQAQNRLDKLERDKNVPVTIETIDSLNGRDITDLLPERAKQNRAK